jgi:hypothetical protein
MRLVVRFVLAGLLPALLVCVPAGCGKDPGKPNPDLKVPDVAPSGREKDKGASTKPLPKP